MTTTTTHLTARHTTAIDLLAGIVAEPGQTKAHHVGDVPARTRAGQYRIITDLIVAGLVRNEGSRSACVLVATDAGVAEAAHWAAR